MCDGKYVFLGAYMCVCTYVSQVKVSLKYILEISRLFTLATDIINKRYTYLKLVIIIT